MVQQIAQEVAELKQLDEVRDETMGNITTSIDKELLRVTEKSRRLIKLEPINHHHWTTIVAGSI